MGRRRPEPDETLEPKLEELAAAFEDGKLEQALALAEELLEEHPKNVEALHHRAAALQQLGRLEEAEAAYREALAKAPEDGELLLGAADLAIGAAGEDRARVEEGLRYCAKGRKLAERARDAELVFEFFLLEAVAYNQIGENELALDRVKGALAHDPESVDARLERALALFELCRFDAALRQLEELLRDAPDDAWVHHHLGLIHERKGRGKDARRHFARARELSPEDFPAPVELRDAEFDAAVDAAVKQLPEHVKKYLENTTLSVQDLPSEDDLLAESPPLSPTILGVFHGTPVGQRSVTSAADHFPARIILYQRNLERFARTREELIEQIGITVMHEVGHLIGLEEEDLWERGLD